MPTLNQLLSPVLESFYHHAQPGTAVLLHPESRMRSILVAQLLKAHESSVLYYALSADDINLNSFLNAIAHAFADQHIRFGQHFYLVNGDAQAELDSYIRAFIDDLQSVGDGTLYVILDEYDRCDIADDIQVFIEKLIANLPPNCILVINSRTLPRLPWISMIAKGRASILQDSSLIDDNFYNMRGEGTHSLEVFAMGPGFVLLNDAPIDTWEGHLPRLLFFFALDKPVITRSEICAAFWPDLDDDQAVNVFHVTKRRLHKALEMDVLVHDDGYYRINPILDVHYDATEFVAKLVLSRNSTEKQRVQVLQQAVELYRGQFLQGHNDAWIAQRREDFKIGYMEALTTLADIRLRESRPETALSLLQKALAESNDREDLHQQVMQLYAQLGRRSEIAAHFQKLLDDSKRVNKSVSEATLSVYHNLMN
jgi:DNA-binding SARP family transcriptional activator